MASNMQAWKRVAISLRELAPWGEPRSARCKPRPLRLEQLGARNLLTADAAPQAILQFTAGATLPGEVAGPVPGQGEFERSLSWAVLPMAEGEGRSGGSTTLDSSCASLEILITSLELHLQALIDMQAPESFIQSAEDAIASAYASLAEKNCDGGPGGGSGGASAGSGGGTSGGGNHTGSGGFTSGQTSAGSGSGSQGGSGASSGGGTTTVGSGGASGSGSSSGATPGSGGQSSSGSSSGGSSGSGSGGASGSGSGGASGSGSGGASGSGSGGAPGSGSGGGTSSGSGESPGGVSAGSSGGYSGGSTGGSWGSGGSSASSTAPTAYTIRNLSITEQDHSTGSNQMASIAEGRYMRVSGEVVGPLHPNGPAIVIRADLNFDASFNGVGETRVVVVPVPATQYWFSAAFWVPDDGPSPGNGTAQDDMMIQVGIADVSVETTATILNVPPRFIAPPTLTFDVDENNEPIAVVTVQIADPGTLDRHTVAARWASGVTTTVQSDEIANATDGGDGIVKTIELVHVLDTAATLRPVTVRAVDDDGGEASFLFDSLDVTLNNDDDNDNAKPDYQEQGFAQEDDLFEYTFGDLVTSQIDTSQGGMFGFSYDNRVIRVWDSPAKTKLIMPSSGFFNPWNHPTGIGEEEVTVIAYTGQESIWVEGISIHATEISLAWPPGGVSTGGVPLSSVFLASVKVTVWGIDFDIDSDNNNGFNYPDGDDWEEYLEDSDYGIGKLIYPQDTHYTPARIRLPRGLDPHDQSIRVKIDFNPVGKSGNVFVWNTEKADPARLDEMIEDGGNRILPYSDFTLAELGYDPASGGITVFIEAATASSKHNTKQGVIDHGKPDDRISASIVGGPFGAIKDEVKYMAVNRDTFYPHLQSNPAIRAALASEGVYSQSDMPNYALKILQGDELQALFASDSEVTQLIGAPPSVPGFKNAIFRDHVSSEYVLAFAGSDDAEDWKANYRQNQMLPSDQYISAMKIAVELSLSKAVAKYRMISTGHSLGGGLASAAAMATGYKAYTYNAAGLREKTLLVYDYLKNKYLETEMYWGSLRRYSNAAVYVDAYYLDLDILSAVQDNSPLIATQIPVPELLATYFPDLEMTVALQPAIGNRIAMDGPLDEEFMFVLFAPPLPLPPPLPPVPANVVAALGLMAAAHLTNYYQYGLMVNERTGWDIYGVDLSLDVIANQIQ